MTYYDKESPVVVLGGGAAGLPAAVRLVRTGRKVVVIEKQPYLGGLAATIRQGPFRLDLGPHAFHCKNDETDAFYKEFCTHGVKPFQMKASLLLHGKYFEYPLKFGQAMLRLEPTFTARMLFDYAGAQLRGLFTEAPEDSFEAWGVKRYGRVMYDLAFGNYSRKVWGMPTNRLHRKLAEQKLPDLNCWELIREALGGKGGKQKILYSSYAYPTRGSGVVFDSIGEEIRRAGGRILLKHEPVEIEVRNSRVVAVTVKGEGESQRIPCSVVFNSIPLNDFARCFRGDPDISFDGAAHELTYRHLLLAYLEISKANVTNEIMVYLLDPEFSFNRIGEQKNIAPEMAPENRTMICLEICTGDNDEWRRMSDEEVLETAKRDLLRLGTVLPGEIRGGFVKRVKQAYPIYDMSFDRNLSRTLASVEKLENVYSLGRQGLFLNNDIHTSMTMSLKAAAHYMHDEARETWLEYVRRQLDWRLE